MFAEQAAVDVVEPVPGDQPVPAGRTRETLHRGGGTQGCVSHNALRPLTTTGSCCLADLTFTLYCKRRKTSLNSLIPLLHKMNKICSKNFEVFCKKIKCSKILKYHSW